jgi:peptidoglycan/LPS O-acetylase OafA/YrhL
VSEDTVPLRAALEHGATARPETEEATPPRGMAHLRSLDGLRGVAVLAVVLYHFSPGFAPGGFLGVDIFFVLSGFLITSLLVREWEGTRRLALPSFWARRARRLLPALFLVLAAVGLWALFLSNHAQANNVAQDGLAAFNYVANWHFIASGQNYIQQFVNQAPSPLRHMWSLGIEEQFYVIWPLLVSLVGLVALRGRRGHGRTRRAFRRVLLGVCLVLGVASFWRMVSLYTSSHNVNRVYYGTDSRAYMLLAGAALGALTAGAPAIKRYATRRWCVAAGTVLAVALVVMMARLPADASWLYEWGYGLVCLAIAVVLVAAVQPGPNGLGAVLRTTPLVKLGLISYGVYLWHWPIEVWVTPQSIGVSGVALFVVRCGLTLAVSIASYVLIEQPIRQGHLPRLPRIELANRGIVPAALVTLVAVLLLVPALTYSAYNVASASTATVGAGAVAARYAAVDHCTDRESGSLVHPDSHAPVVLLGNSVAAEVAPCLTSILAARGVTLNSYTQDAASPCDFATFSRHLANNPSTKPRVVLLFGIPVSISACGKQSAWLPQIRTVLSVWKRAGVHVYLVPALGRAGSTKPDPTVAEYEHLAQADPGSVSVLDASIFVRDVTTRFEWRAPCLNSSEAGCADQTIGVRMVEDGGEHFCAHVVAGPTCPAALAGGARRGAAAIAAELLGAPQFIALLGAPR